MEKENKGTGLILKETQDLILGAKRLIDRAYENKDIGKMKDIHDQAVVLQDLAKRRDMGIDLGNEIAEIRLYDERKIGELLPDIIRKPEEGRPEGLHDATLLRDIGLNKSQSSRWQSISRIPETQFNEEIQKIKSKKVEITTNHFLDISKQIDKEIERLKKSKEGEDIKVIDNEIDFRLGNFIEVLNDIPDNSVSLVLTDPPYTEEYMPIWSDLSLFASKKLKKNGFLVSYSGHIHLLDAMNRLNEHLDYYWIFALLHKDRGQLVHPRSIIADWKPLLIYQNGIKKRDNKIHDIIEGTGREKGDHDWQQSEGELEYLINSFSDEGDTIVDPFAGSGTVLIASKKLNRIAIGTEIDEQSYNIAKKRISENI